MTSLELLEEIVSRGDGEKELRVAAPLIRAVSAGASSGSAAARSAGRRSGEEPEGAEPLRMGQKVEAAYRGGSRYFPGVISRARPGNMYDIDYDDGEKEQRVAASLIRPVGGMRGGARAMDSEDEAPVARRSGGGGSRLSEGSKVEANYRGKGRYYPGVIKRDRGDGSPLLAAPSCWHGPHTSLATTYKLPRMRTVQYVALCRDRFVATPRRPAARIAGR